ncbi:hypothetical protein [Vibrio owensii]|uniref:hypothetical protein n=1 Tax=Vibrio harveyi group TaxID=717610 RepID=UPI003CC6BA7E
MSSPDKSRFYKDFSSIVSTVYSKVIKPNKSISSRIFKSRKELAEYFGSGADNEHYDRINQFEYMLNAHCLSLYEMKHHFIGFSFSFPSQFKDYDDLVSQISIDCQLTDKYSREQKTQHIHLSLNGLQEVIKRFNYFASLYEKYDVLKYVQASPDQMRFELLESTMFEYDYTSGLYDFLNKHSDYTEELLTAKFNYQKCRSSINRARKQRKKNEGTNLHPTVKENLQKIRELQEQIAKLKAENEQIEKAERDKVANQGENPERLFAIYQNSLRRYIDEGLQSEILKSAETESIGTTLFNI